MPITISLEGLDETALVKILTEPKNALIKQYKKLFAMDEVELIFEDEAVSTIAALAMERKTGARGLRSIIEQVMMDVMYRIPSDDTIATCIITKGAVLGESEPEIIKREMLKKAR